MSCLKCFNCKICRAQGYMRCAEEEWVDNVGNEKRIKLSHTELTDCFIRKRKLFEQKEYCPLFTPA